MYSKISLRFFDGRYNQRTRRGECFLDIQQPIANYIENLSEPYALEHSLKIQSRALLDGRGLYSIRKFHLGFRPRPKLLRLCAELHIPPAFADAIEALFDQASVVHLGFENGEIPFCKVYLEFTTRRPESLPANLLFRGFKWSPLDNTQAAVTDYCERGKYKPADLSPYLDYYLEPQHEAERALAQSFVELVGDKAPDAQILLLDVTEAGSPRRSFDINVYDAATPLSDLAPWLRQAYRVFGIKTPTPGDLLSPPADRKLGHLSGGVSRKGAPFFTVYHSVSGR